MENVSNLSAYYLNKNLLLFFYIHNMFEEGRKIMNIFYILNLTFFSKKSFVGHKMLTKKYKIIKLIWQILSQFKKKILIKQK